MQVVDDVAMELYNAGRIQDPCRDAGFFERLTLIEKQFPSASVLLHKRGVLPEATARCVCWRCQSLSTFVSTTSALTSLLRFFPHSAACSMWASPQLLDVAQQLLGPNLAGHPVWNLRTKVGPRKGPNSLVFLSCRAHRPNRSLPPLQTPNQEQTTVPWHQDIAYLDEGCWTTLQLTAWIPLLDANVKNGCMQVVRGGHRTGRAGRHTCCVGGTWWVSLECA
jgi:hypothetical protein